jgi:hypothetical protein
VARRNQAGAGAVRISETILTKIETEEDIGFLWDSTAVVAGAELADVLRDPTRPAAGTEPGTGT